MSKAIEIAPIGFVRNDRHDPKRHDWADVESEILVNDELAEQLDGLDDFSHILVLFWLDRVTAEERKPRKVHPQKRQDLPLVGVFATRTPSRPNPIGITEVRLLERRCNVLRVRGLDAIDGTPVLDLKPFLPGTETKEDIHMPAWAENLSTWGGKPVRGNKGP